MKKFILSALACMMMLGAQAQIVSSRSVSVKTETTPKTTTYFLRAGLGLMNVHGSDVSGTDSNLGYNFVYGFQKTLSNDIYWGMDLGLGSRGFKIKSEDLSFIAHNVQVSPFTIGWKPTLTSDINLDLHAGVYAGIDYTGKFKGEDYSVSLSDYIDEDEDYKRYDVGLNIGVGIWYDRYNFDITYQTGFIEEFYGIKSHNILLRLGIAF